MFNISIGIALIFIIFQRVIYAQKPITLLNSSEAAEALAEIQISQALPLVLFQLEFEESADTLRPISDVLQLPKNIIKAETIDRRMIQGTEFSNESGTQTFFCPKQDFEKDCLAPQEFNKMEFLICAKEPNPVTYLDFENRDVCGQTNGISYNIAYDICPQSNEYEIDYIPFYGFCYDTNNRNTTYTYHIISSPYLLQSNLLYREKRVKYPIIVRNTFKPSNLDAVNIESIKDLDLLAHPKTPLYKLQMSVPNENMALALWRKTTYQNVNLKWQHGTLIPLWNQMNYYISSHASEIFKNNTKILVRTGVIDINLTSEDNTQIFNVWVNMIITEPPKPHMIPVGVVILMNNFIRTEADGTPQISKAVEEAIDDFCLDDKCIKTFRKDFDKVGGRVRCCSLSKDNVKVRELFGMQKDLDARGDIFMFRIPGITTKNFQNNLRF